MNFKNSVYKSNNVTYYVNHTKKVVVAKIRCDVATPLYIFDRMFDKFESANGNHNLLEMHFDRFYANKAFISEHYIGIARCREGDTFDIEFGKKLALARAKAKKAYAVNRCFFKYIEQLDDLNYFAGKKSDELYRRWIDCETEVEDLLKSITHKVD